MAEITSEALLIKQFIESEWGHLFDIRLEIRLSELFPRPSNHGLLHIWKYGTADIVVSQNGVVKTIIEPGGSHHWEERQSLNDRRKWKLAELNGVNCLNLMNGVVGGISKRQSRRMFGAILFKSYRQILVA